jgi:hypothetical protein
VREDLLEEEEDYKDKLVGIDFITVVAFYLPHQVPDVDQRSVLKLFFGKEGATFVIKFVDFGEGSKNVEAVVHLVEFGDFCDVYFVVGGVGGYFLEEDHMYVDKQLTLKFEFLAIIEIVVFKLFLLVSFGWTADLGIAVLHIRLLLPLLVH